MNRSPVPMFLCAFLLLPAAASGDDLPEGAVARLGTARMRYRPPGWHAPNQVRYGAGAAEAWIVSGKELHRWKLDDCTSAGRHAISTKQLRTLDVAPGGQDALISDAAGVLYQWNAGGKTARRLFDTGRTSLLAAIYSPDRKRVLTLDHDSSTLEEWSVSGGKPRAAVSSRQFYNAVYGPEGKTAFIVRRPARNVFHYDLTRKKTIKTFLDDYYCRTVAVSPDGTHLLSGSRHRADEWRISDYKSVGSYSGHPGAEVVSVAYTPDGARLLTGGRDGSIRLWDRKKRKPIRRFLPHRAHVVAMFVTQDGKRVLSWGRDGLLTESLLATGEPRVRIERHMGHVCALAATTDGSRVLTGSTDGTVRVWEARTGRSLGRIVVPGGEVHSVTVLPGDDRVAAAARDGSICVLGLSDGKVRSRLRGHRGYARSVAVSSGGVFVSGGDDGCVVVPAGEEPKKPEQRLRGHLGGVMCVALSPDGGRAASGGRDGTLRVWDLASGKQVSGIYAHAGWVESVAFDPKGTHVLSGGGDGEVVEWSLPNCTPKRVFVHGKSVHAVAYAGNGGAVCAGGEDGVVTVWSRTAEEKPARLEGHGGPVLSLIPLPGGRLVSGSADTTALVWKLPGGQR